MSSRISHAQVSLKRRLALAASVVAITAVLHASPDLSRSSVSASSLAIDADGTSTSIITVTLRDGTGTQLPSGGNAVVLTTTLGTMSAVTDGGNGTYTATLTSGTTVASAKITATVDGSPVVAPLYVNFTTRLVAGTPVDDVGTTNSIAAGNTSRNLAVGTDGTIYAVFRGATGIRVASSRNRGATFSPSVQVAVANVEAEVAVSTTGVVYVTWISGGLAQVSRSFDNGETFATPVAAGNASASVHIATDASRVYLVDRQGNNFYWSADNAATFTRVQLNAAEVYADVHVDPQTSDVIVQVDNPAVKYFVSTNGGQTFSAKLRPSPTGSVYYSVGAISSGPLGRYLFVAGSGSNMYRIDLGTTDLTGLTATAVSQTIGTASSQGRSLAADRCGNIVVGYISSSNVKFDVSNDLGGRYNAPVTVAAATDANVYIDQTNGDILFLYQSSGRIYLSTYSGHLGNCYSPEVSVSSVAFSSVLVGQVSAPQSVRITNAGGVPVQVTGITTSGDFAATTACIGTLAVGAYCEVPVTFSPTVSGTRTGTLQLATNIFVEPRVVTLTGTGLFTAPVASLSPTALNFGTVAAATTSAAQIITLTNSGNQALTISSFTISAPFTLSANACAGTLAPATSCTLSVTASPATASAASGSLRLMSNVTGAPPTVTLEVNGVAPPPPSNTPPTATDDRDTVAEDGVLTRNAAAGVLANDTDGDGDPMTAVLGTGPAHGTLSLGGDGSFAYTPARNYSGQDSFTYQATDGSASSALTTVSLTVAPVNDVPTLDQPAPLAARWDAGAQLVTLTGISAGGGEADVLTVTALSTTQGAVVGPVAYAGGTSASLTVTPVVGFQGLVTITVAVNDGQATTTRPMVLTVTAPSFYLTGVYPATGPATGGTNIRISGSGFLQSAAQIAGLVRAAVVTPQVLIGGVPVTALVIESDSVISAMTPALPAGTALAVQVVVPAGTGLLPAAYTPYARPADPTPPTEPTDPAQRPADPTHPQDPTAPITDTDGDGMTDVWEEFYGTDPRDASDATADPDADGRTNKQEFDSNDHPDSRSTRYFAEGNANASFRTWVNMYNPSPIEAAINITFYLDDATVVHHLVKAPGGARTTVDASSVAALQGHAFGLKVDADETVVINRTITWNEQGIGAAAERGVELSSAWYFAEGTTHAHLQTFAMLTNPADAPATVEIEYLVSGAGLRVMRTHIVPAHARYTVWVNQEGAEMADQGFGMVVRSSHPIVAERATYITTGTQFEAGETSVGAPTTGTDWYFAEGVAGPVFNTFLLLANPTDIPAEVQVRYLPESGAEVVSTHTVGPYSRVTIPAANEANWHPQMGFGMHAHVTNGVGIVAERAMWWSTDADHQTWEEGHGSAGSQTTGLAYAIGDGVAGGAQGASTYLLIANPGTAQAQLRVTLGFEDGSAPVTADLTVDAGRRVTVDVATLFPVADGKRFSAKLESLNNVPFLAEQSIYWTFGTGVWKSGVSLPATRLQ